MRTDMNIYAGNPEITLRNIVESSDMHRKSHEQFERLREAIHGMPEGSPERKEKIEKLDFYSKRKWRLLEAAEIIYELFRTIPRRSRRMAKAERCFLNGDFAGIDDALPEEEIVAEVDRLKHERVEQYDDEFKQTEFLLQEISYELLLKGMLHYTRIENPEWYEDLWRLLMKSLDASVNTHTFYSNGWYCFLCNEYDRAKEFYEDAMDEHWMEEGLSDENRLFFKARCLRRLANISKREDDLPAAIRTLQQALTLFTQLKDKNPDAYTTEVAKTLATLGDYHLRTKAYSVALVEYEESLRIYRQLAVNDNDAYLPLVAEMLNSAGGVHILKKEYQDAITCYEEAISIERSFLEVNRYDFMTMLTTSFNNMITAYFVMNRLEKLIPLLTELVAMYRELAATSPNLYLPKLAYALCQLAIQCRFWKEREEAYGDIREGIAIFRELALQSPSDYLSALAVQLSELDDWCWNDDNEEESFVLCREITDIYRRLVEESPEKYLPKLGETLDRLAAIYHSRGDDETSLTVYLEGIEVSRRLVKQDRRYGHVLGHLLMGLGVYYSDIFPDKEKSIAAANEACAVLQPFRKKDPQCEKSYHKAKGIIRAWG